jgi:hypothetical protein
VIILVWIRCFLNHRLPIMSSDRGDDVITTFLSGVVGLVVFGSVIVLLLSSCS